MRTEGQASISITRRSDQRHWKVRLVGRAERRTALQVYVVHSRLEPPVGCEQEQDIALVPRRACTWSANLSPEEGITRTYLPVR